MKLSRLVPIIAVLALAVAVAGCGGGSDSASDLSSTDVAVVGEQSISKTQFQDLMATAEASFKQQGRKFPKQGTSEYASIKSQAVTLLVQQAEREQKAKALGIDISDKQIDDRLAQIKKQYFQGKESTYKAQLKKQGLSEEQVRSDIRAQLISEALFKKVTNDVKVSDADVHAYYVAHGSEYQQPESRKVATSSSRRRAGRRRLRAAEERRRFRQAREEILARHGLRGAGRQLRRGQGPLGRTVRQGCVRAEDERDLAAGQDPVRLARDPGAERDQARGEDAREAGRTPDPAAAAADEAQRRRQRLGEGPAEGLLQGLADQVPGRIRADPRSLHDRVVRRHRHRRLGIASEPWATSPRLSSISNS